MENIEKKKGDDVGILKCISRISSIRMAPWPHVGRQLQRNITSGYVYAIEELGSNMVFIGWGGRTPLKETLVRLQKGNPRQLRIMNVLQRSNVYDANELCKFIHRGLFLENIQGNWFDIEHSKIQNMFGSIDKITQ